MNQAACEQAELSAEQSRSLPRTRDCHRGQLQVTFPLFVCIYLLSFHVESFGQRKMQGHTEKKQDGFRH